jgi:hypothetical protein
VLADLERDPHLRRRGPSVGGVPAISARPTPTPPSFASRDGV